MCVCTHKHILPVNYQAKYYLFFKKKNLFLTIFQPQPVQWQRCPSGQGWQTFRLNYFRASHHLPRGPLPRAPGRRLLKTERGGVVEFVSDSSEALFGFIRSKESSTQARSSSAAMLARLVPRAQAVTRRGPWPVAPGTTNPIRGRHSQTGPPQRSGLGPTPRPIQHPPLLSARQEKRTLLILAMCHGSQEGPGRMPVQSLSVGRQNPISVKKDLLSPNIHRKYGK